MMNVSSRVIGRYIAFQRSNWRDPVKPRKSLAELDAELTQYRVAADRARGVLRMLERKSFGHIPQHRSDYRMLWS
jgi:hypothetical protein